MTGTMKARTIDGTVGHEAAMPPARPQNTITSIACATGSTLGSATAAMKTQIRLARKDWSVTRRTVRPGSRGARAFAGRRRQRRRR